MPHDHPKAYLTSKHHVRKQHEQHHSVSLSGHIITIIYRCSSGLLGYLLGVSSPSVSLFGQVSCVLFRPSHATSSGSLDLNIDGLQMASGEPGSNKGLDSPRTIMIRANLLKVCVPSNSLSRHPIPAASHCRCPYRIAYHGMGVHEHVHTAHFYTDTLTHDQHQEVWTACMHCSITCAQRLCHCMFKQIAFLHVHMTCIIACLYYITVCK